MKPTFVHIAFIVVSESILFKGLEALHNLDDVSPSLLRNTQAAEADWILRNKCADIDSCSTTSDCFGDLSDDGTTLVFRDRHNGQTAFLVKYDTCSSTLLEFDGFFGHTLSGDGNKVAMKSSSGTVKVFEDNNNSLIQHGGDIQTSIQQSGFLSLSDDGNTVAVSASFDDGAFSFAKVYRYDKKCWHPGWHQLGDNIDRDLIVGKMHKTVTLSDDGNTICIATFRHLDQPIGHGNCYTRVFRFDGNDWTQLGSDIEFMPAVWDPEYFSTISGDGNTVAVTSIDAAFTSQGTVKVYTYNGDAWNQQGSTLNLFTGVGHRWNSVSLSDDGTVLAFGEGAPWTFTKAKVFQYQDNDWFKRGKTIIRSQNAQRWVPVSLSASGDSVFLGGTGPIEIYDYLIAPAASPTISAAPTTGSMSLALAFADLLDSIIVLLEILKSCINPE